MDLLRVTDLAGITINIRGYEAGFNPFDYLFRFLKRIRKLFSDCVRF